jgi:hypothetical protein
MCTYKTMIKYAVISFARWPYRKLKKNKVVKHRFYFIQLKHFSIIEYKISFIKTLDEILDKIWQQCKANEKFCNQQQNTQK